MNIKDLYTRISETREYHMANSPDLEKRIAQRLGIHKQKTFSFSQFFAIPAFAFAALLCVVTLSSNTANAAKHSVESFFLNYHALGTTENPFIFLGCIAVFGYLVALGLSIWATLHFASHKHLKTSLLGGICLLALSPAIVILLHISTYTVDGTISEIRCTENTILLRNSGNTVQLHFPENGSDETPMSVLQSNGEPLGEWSRSTFCDPSGSSSFLALVQNTSFTVTANRLGSIVSWKAHDALPVLGAVLHNEDIVITSLVWSGDDIEHQGHVDVTVKGNHINSTISSADPSVFPELNRLTETTAIILLRTETRCSTLVYVIDRETGVMDPMAHEGCFLASTEDGTLYFEDHNGINAYHIWDKTLVVPSTDPHLSVFTAAVSPDSKHIAFVLWDGMFEETTGKVVVFDTETRTTETLSEKYWNTLQWNDNKILTVNTETEHSTLTLQ